MDAIRVHPGISHTSSLKAAYQARTVPEMQSRLANAPQPDRQLWTGTQLMARVRATPDHQTVAQAHR